MAAKRIMWGKCVNAGQTCIAPDHILVQEDAEDTIIERLKDAFVRLQYTSPFLIADSFLCYIDTTSFIQMAPSFRLTSAIWSTRSTLTMSRVFWRTYLEKSCLVVKPTSPGYLLHLQLSKE